MCVGGRRGGGCGEGALPREAGEVTGEEWRPAGVLSFGQVRCRDRGEHRGHTHGTQSALSLQLFLLGQAVLMEGPGTAGRRPWPETSSPKAWRETRPGPRCWLVEEGRGEGGEREKLGEKLGKINPRFILRCSISCQKADGSLRARPTDAKAFSVCAM